MTILAIDFEASCLPRHGRSFPIEVGISGEGWTRSWIIRPHESWAAWDWKAEAEALHGLSIERVRREGLPVEAVLDRLVAAVDGCRVIADSVIDQYWLETLAQAAGEPAPFIIDHVSLLMDEYGAGERHIRTAVGFADALHPTRHRAGADAAWLAGFLEHLTGSAPFIPALPSIPRYACQQ